MKETGEDKIKQICDSLRKETLEPAKQEAEAIIAEAKAKAAQIVKEAEAEAERIFSQTKAEIEQERNVFQSSLAQAAKQSLETLRQEVEKKLFNQELDEVICKEAAKPDVIANLIRAIVEAVEKTGIDADLEAVIPQSVSPKEVSGLLGEKILEKLKGDKVSVGTFEGGAQVRLLGNKMTIDITDDSLKDLMASYIRKDFRKMIFAS